MSEPDLLAGYTDQKGDWQVPPPAGLCCFLRHRCLSLHPTLKRRATSRRRLKPAFSPIYGAWHGSPESLAPGEGSVRYCASSIFFPQAPPPSEHLHQPGEDLVV